jgi:hypothetical protein
VRGGLGDLEQEEQLRAPPVEFSANLGQARRLHVAESLEERDARRVLAVDARDDCVRAARLRPLVEDGKQRTPDATAVRAARDVDPPA